jgi:hypothetical protein
MNKENKSKDLESRLSKNKSSKTTNETKHLKSKKITEEERIPLTERKETSSKSKEKIIDSLRYEEIKDTSIDSSSTLKDKSYLNEEQDTDEAASKRWSGKINDSENEEIPLVVKKSSHHKKKSSHSGIVLNPLKTLVSSNTDVNEFSNKKKNGTENEGFNI